MKFTENEYGDCCVVLWQSICMFQVRAGVGDSLVVLSFHDGAIDAVLSMRSEAAVRKVFAIKS
jgi:hypothetical protein